MDGLRRFAAPSSFSLASPSTGGPTGGPPQKEDITVITGTVKFFNADKGYGFIQPEDGSSDAFVHISAVEAAGMRTLDREQRVTYDLENDRRGRTSAVNLQAA
jgi:cold shock protein